MTAVDFPDNPQPGDAFLNFVWDGEKWRNAGSQSSAVILKDLFEFSVAADDSTLRPISTGESIKFIGSGTVNTASDAEGNITITGAATNLTGYATETFVTSQGYLTSVGTISYNDLSNKPLLFSGSYNDLTNKPTLFSGSYTDLTNKPTLNTTLASLTDVATAGAITGQVLTYDSITQRWIPGGAGGGSTGALGYYGSFYDVTAQQSNAGATTANLVTIGGVYESNGVTIQSGSKITFSYAGTYSIVFSLQFVNDSAVEQDVSVWLKNTVGGVTANVADSTVVYTIDADTGALGKLVAINPFIITVQAGEQIQIYWQSPSTDVYLKTIAAQTTPAVPRAPAVILTVEQTSSIVVPDSIAGNAATATKLLNARTINNVSFDGSGNITVTANTTNALTIGTGLSGTSFNGSTAITIAVDNTVALRADTHYIGTTAIALNRASASQTLTGVSISGNAGTVTNGVYTTDTGTVTNTMLAGNIANAKLFNSTVTIGSTVVALGTTAVNLAGLNSVTATNFIGNATTVTNGVYTNSIGVVTDIMLAGSIANNKLTNSSITVNGTSISLGSSATIKASTTNALTIGTGLSGTSFDGGSAVTIALASGYGDTQNPYASKTANNFLAAPNGSAGAPTFRAIVAADIPTLNQNTTGSAATLTTARNINGVSFNGSADITVTAAAGTLTGSTLASGVTASSLTSVGTLTNLSVTNTITGSVSGNAGTATKLATARAINGVDFDGSAAITVTAAAGTLTGTTLNSSVVSSSLTSVGTLTSLSSGAITTTGTLALNASGGITTNQTTFPLVNTTATTVNFAGAATALNMGASTGTTTVNNMLKINFTGSTDSSIQVTGNNTKGGAGYHDFLKVTNTGQTNPNKFFRLTSTGTLQILNSAYSANIFSVTDAGFIDINASTGTTNGVPVNNAIAMNSNSYIYDDGNYHLTAKTGNIWLNSNNGGAVSINQQVPSGTAAGGLAVTGPVNAQTGYYARTAWNSAIDTEITVDDYRFRISNQGGIFPQVISNTAGTKNSAWVVVAARSGSAITQTGSTGTLVANNAWTTLYNSGGMDSAGDTYVATLQDKSQGRIYRVTFMRSDNGSTTGYNIIAERLL